MRRQAIISTNDGEVYWRLYSSLGLNELGIKMSAVTIMFKSHKTESPVDGGLN